MLAAIPYLAARKPQLRWVAPLEPRFKEPRDDTFLQALGLQDLSDDLKAFWPKGGPVWDALAICEFSDGSEGYVLAEGKS